MSGIRKDIQLAEKLYKSIGDGRLGLPNLKLLISALKLTWMRKISKTTHKWKNVVLANYPSVNDISFHGPGILKTKGKNTFWTQVFDAFSDLYYRINPANSQDLLAEPVCFNERITIGNKSIKERHWKSKGTYCVAHFLSDDGKLLSYAEMKRKHDWNVDFITYSGCKLAIKKYMQKYDMIEVCTSEASNTNACLKKLHSVNRGCKIYYDILLRNDFKPKCCHKGEEKLNNPINWHACFHSVRRIQDINMKWFQIRILHRILGTNVVLEQIGLMTDNKCSFCSTVKDGILHMLWDCAVIQQFWEQFIELVKRKCHNCARMKLSANLVILGVDKDIKIDAVFYFILLFAKQYLYKCEIEKCQPSVTVFSKRVLSRHKIEEYNTKVNLMYPTFYVNWLYYKPLFID